MKSSAKVKLLSYAACVLGVLAFLTDYFLKFSDNIQLHNVGYGLAIFGLVFLGTIGICIAEGFKGIEDRLDKLENSSIKK